MFPELGFLLVLFQGAKVTIFPTWQQFNCKILKLVGLVLVKPWPPFS